MPNFNQHKAVRRGIFSRFSRWGVVKLVLLSGLALAAVGTLVMLGALAWYSRDLPNPDALLNRTVSQSTKIYDRTGTKLLYEIAPSENRTLVKIEDMPQYLKDAVVAAEDRRFYQHHGIDYLGLIRAVGRSIITLSPIKGTSTITQQLVKNAILTPERTFGRKIKEVMLSLAIEQKFTKQQILQLYLNEIAYGSTNYGVQSASKAYFNKDVKDITLAEAATLAALPNRPSGFLNDPAALKGRRDWILDNMESFGYASHADVAAAKATDTPVHNDPHAFEAPHFVQWVKDMLENTYGTQVVGEGGLQVITTLDLDKQHFAEKAVTDGVAANGVRYGFTDAALLSMDPKTGEVLAMVGSADFKNNDIGGQINMTLRSLQPGSSIKPMVYAAAFQKGYTPDTLLWDVSTTFPTDTGPYTPQNYDEGEHGLVTIRKALQGSLNIPAVKTLYLVGIANFLPFAQKMGYTTLNDASQVGLSLALGGANVKMIDHVGAYAALANGGVRHDPLAILKVTDASGKVLEEHKPEAQPNILALDPSITATVSNVLSDNAARTYIFGAHNYLTLGDRPVAAKTGTTNSYTAAWTMGYTPSLVAGVWVGNANNALMSHKADGSVVAAPIWNEYMSKSLQGTAVEQFPAYTPEKTGKAVLDGVIPGQTADIDTVTGKLATDQTPASRRETRVCGEFHTILQYISKDDPRGPAPEHPADDPYYSVFESAIQDYIGRHNAALKPGEAPIESCTLPTERDDVHVMRNAPSIVMNAPSSNTSVGRVVSTSLSTSTVLPFHNVSYYIDGVFFAASGSPSGDQLTLPGYVRAGAHTLTAEVHDSADNTARAEASISVTEDGGAQGISITNPFAQQKIEVTQASYTVVLEIPNNGDLVSLRLTARSVNNNAESTIADIAAPGPIVQAAWMLPASGEYVLEAVGMTATGQKVYAQAVPVSIVPPVPEGVPFGG